MGKIQFRKLMRIGFSGWNDSQHFQVQVQFSRILSTGCVCMACVRTQHHRLKRLSIQTITQS